MKSGQRKGGANLRELKSIRKRVRFILIELPKARRSDKWLYIKYLELFGTVGLTNSEQKTLLRLLRKAKLPHYPSVWRSRQFIQKNEPSLVDNITSRERRKLEKVYRLEFGKNSVTKLDKRKVDKFGKT